MKNLFLSAALVLAFAAGAQTTETPTTTTPPVNTPVQVTPVQAENQNQEKEYLKVSQSQIAPEVLKQAVAKYKDYALVEALVAKDGTDYKLVLTKDGTDVAAFYSSKGEFLKEETV
ncbi:MAG: hypothetical protein EOO45_02755 [Flavobacterium sp.]|nr:MAG: hypothetical protein EOO45_02755 [Flavobacterium sp.]